MLPQSKLSRKTGKKSLGLILPISVTIKSQKHHGVYSFISVGLSPVLQQGQHACSFPASTEAAGSDIPPQVTLASQGEGSILEMKGSISVCHKWAGLLKQAHRGAGFLERDLLGGTEHLHVDLCIAEHTNVPLKVSATRS